MNEIKFIASPGIAVLREIQETSDSKVNFGNIKKGRIKKAQIISMGQDVLTDANALLKTEDYGKVGDIVYFLHYYDEGGYDYTTIDNVMYFFVKWQDFRAIV